MRRLAWLIVLSGLVGCPPAGKGEDSEETDSPVVTDDGDADRDGFPEGMDCDDDNPNINQNAPEVCDGIDNDCDAEIDEDGGEASYLDSDQDGFGDAASVSHACTLPSGYATNDQDCDDANQRINPDATEVCDEADNDCDGDVDGGLLLSFYLDGDGDGAGGPAAISACTAPTGYFPTFDDCDDQDATVFPGATERCNGTDDNCDGQADEGVRSIFYADTDRDGFGDPAVTQEACAVSAGWVTDNTDCDDTGKLVYPGAAESCDFLDDDCDGTVDEDVLISFYNDADGDGFGDPNQFIDACFLIPGHTTDGTDCDDGNAAISPAALEVCDTNAIDENCNGLADDDDTALDLSTALAWYEDNDGNGVGNSSTMVTACVAPSGYVGILPDAATVVCSQVLVDDSSDAASVAGAAFSVDPSGAFTLLFRATLDEVTVGHLFVKGDNATNEWSLTSGSTGNTGELELCFNQQGLAQLLCANAQAGAPHTYALVYDNQNISLYEDGVEIGAGTGTIGAPQTSSALTLFNYPGDSIGSTGAFDSISFWNTARSASEIQSLSAGSTSPSDYSGLQAWWPFDEGSGASSLDISGNGQDLSLSGLSWSPTCP